MTFKSSTFCLLLTVLMSCVARPAVAQWQTSTLLNLPSEWNNGAQAIKAPKLIADSVGVHAIYNQYLAGGGNNIRYRHYDTAGGFTNSSIAASGAFLVNPDVAELGNGTIAVTYEDWAGGPRLGYSQSTNNGASWTGATILPTATSNVKWPQLTREGTGSNSRSMITYFDSSNNDIRYKHNGGGGGFGGDTYIGSDGSSEYTVQIDTQAYGKDGSVWRFWGEGSSGNRSIRYRRFDPVSQVWSAAQTAASGLTGFISRFSAAMSDGGKVMVVFDMDSASWGVTRDTNGSWSSAVNYNTGNNGFFGNVVARPSTNDFYIFNAYSLDFPVMRPVLDGVLAQPLEYPGQDIGFSNAYIPWVQGAIDEQGRAFATWEHWGSSGQPQAYITHRDLFPPVPEPASIALAGIGLVGLVAWKVRRRRH